MYSVLRNSPSVETSYSKGLPQNRLGRGTGTYLLRGLRKNEPVPDGSGIGSKSALSKVGGLVLIALFTAVLWSDSPKLYAEVIAEGDVTPNSDPDLPLFGGPASGTVRVGINDSGRLTVDVPAFTAPLVSPGGIIGEEAGGIGEAVIAGFGSEWEIQGDFFVGDRGLAFLSLIGGAKLSSTDEVDPNDPSMVITDASTIVGNEVGSTGIVSIDGFGSRMLTAALTVGNEGDGSIDIFNRGNLITSGVASIGVTTNMISSSTESPVGRVSLTDLGSRWTVTDSLTIGTDNSGGTGRAALEIGNQAQVQVGNQEASDLLLIDTRGSVELSGGGTLRTLTGASGSPVPIDNRGVIKGDGFVDGSIDNIGDIRSAASLANFREVLLISGDVENGVGADSGLIESIGGEMEFLGTVNNNSNGDIVARDAIMRFQNGLVNNGEFAVGGDTTIHAAISGSGDFLVLPDSTTLLVGSLTLATSSALSLAVGDAPGTLDILGTADLNNSLLLLNYSGGIHAQSGDSYDVLSASGGVSGMFSNATATADGLLWGITYGTDTVTVTAGLVAMPMGADFNGDGIVDGTDLAIWETFLGSTGVSQTMGDADGDGDVDGADFLKIQMDLGGPPSLVAAVAAVPEPSTLFLALAAVGLCSRRRVL